MDTALQSIKQIGNNTREFLIPPYYCSALQRSQIRLTGISLVNRDFHFVNLPATHAQILVSLRGKGEVLVNGKWKECGPGWAYCNPKGVPSGYRDVLKWEVAWITYEANAPFQLEDILLAEVNPEPIEHIIYGLYQEATHQRDPALMDCWGELLQAQAKRVVAANFSGNLWRLWQKVSANISHPWSLSELTNYMGISSEYLRQLCLRETGQTPMRYVTRLRMQHAISLLSKGYKIQVVSQEVGYENPFAFSTAFKKFSGHAPSHYRLN